MSSSRFCRFIENKKVEMKRVTPILTVALLFTCTISFAQTNMTSLCHYIQEKSSIATGGTEIYEYNGTTYIISVAPVVVSSKSEAQCKTIGNSKAKKEMLAYINGTDITSSTKLTNSETLSTTLDGTKVECKQEYVESIKESILGTISQVSPLGGWYSPDKSVYYFSIYKVI
jgi:hypothetical protein